MEEESSNDDGEMIAVDDDKENDDPMDQEDAKENRNPLGDKTVNENGSEFMGENEDILGDGNSEIKYEKPTSEKSSEVSEHRIPCFCEAKNCRGWLLC